MIPAITFITLGVAAYALVAWAERRWKHKQ
jgi:hypothetical protein